MNTSLNWIKAMVPGLECTDQEFRDAMTLSGTKVECFNAFDKNLDKIVVGQILSVERHPDADKLVICQVNVGSENVQIVTGAPNIEVGSSGQKVPVVLDGGKVAGGHDGGALPEDGIKIKKCKLRGVESCGMMCSIEELGSSREFFPDAPEEGIYIFGDDAVVGSSAVEYLGLNDTVFEYEITNNRVDCYSVIGIAREAAATFRKPFNPPVVTKTGNDEDVNTMVSVDIEAKELCSRYVARVVKNIRLAPSPKWMQQRLMTAGIRPINNIVDITNYVMEEYGQPMHAYDYDTIAGHKIVVRTATDGEKFVTLDGQERTLDAQTLLICDGEKPVGIAGIMGGENSMITDDVQTMLFEAATFDGTNIRKTTKKIGLRTDASGKFEKGLDPENAMEAINRACQLIEELDAGDVVGGVVDVYPDPVTKKRLPFEPAKYNALLGTNVSDEGHADQRGGGVAHGIDPLGPEGRPLVHRRRRPGGPGLCRPAGHLRVRHEAMDADAQPLQRPPVDAGPGHVGVRQDGGAGPEGPDPGLHRPGGEHQITGVVKVRRGVDGPLHQRRLIRRQDDPSLRQLRPDDAEALRLNVSGAAVFQLSHASSSLRRPEMSHTGFCPIIRFSPPAPLDRAAQIWVTWASSPRAAKAAAAADRVSRAMALTHRRTREFFPRAAARMASSSPPLPPTKTPSAAGRPASAAGAVPRTGTRFQAPKRVRLRPPGDIGHPRTFSTRKAWR